MKKLLLVGVAISAIVGIGAMPAYAEMTKVDDPTPNGAFTGTYVVSNDDPNTPENEYQEGTQTGYVGADAEGQYVVACNGNPALTRPDDGSPLVGYVWVGPNGAASNPTAQSPGGVVGAGNNHEDADANPTGESPCP